MALIVCFFLVQFFSVLLELRCLWLVWFDIFSISLLLEAHSSFDFWYCGI